MYIFSPPYDRLCKEDDIRYVIVIVPRNNGGRVKVPIDKAVNET